MNKVRPYKSSISGTCHKSCTVQGTYNGQRKKTSELEFISFGIGGRNIINSR